jgi:predicted permease
LFTPALLFSKVAFFLSPEKLGELWVIPIFFVVVTLASMFVAFTLGSLLRLKRSERNFAIAAAMFMNSNSLPIALMQSLVVTISSLKWGDDDNKNAMLGRALTYLVLYSTLGMVLRWSYGVKLLAQADVPSPRTTALPEEQQPLLFEPVDENEGGDQVGNNSGASTPHYFSSSIATFTADPEAVEDLRAEHSVKPVTTPQKPKLLAARRSTYYRSFPNSPNQSQTHLPSIESEAPSREHSQADLAHHNLIGQNEDDDEDSRLPVHRGSHQRRKGVWTRTGRAIVRFWITFNDFMTVPLWAAAASLIVALIQPLQHTLDVHMQPLKGALTAAGNCSIPLTLVVLGAYFYPDPSQKKKEKKTLTESVRAMFNWRRPDGTSERPIPVRSKTEIRQEGETKTVIVAVASRMILTPMLILPLMAVGTYWDIHRVFMDPVFVVANVLLVTSPPALTLAQITQAASGDAFERLISRTIFWSYCIITPPATIVYVVIGLILAKL